MKHGKKLMALAAAALVSVSLLAGCGGETGLPENGEEMYTNMINPLQSFSLEELRSETGYNLQLPEDCANVVVTKINVVSTEVKDPAPLYEVEFQDQSGNEYCFRMQMGQSEEDISGMYYEWTEALIIDEVDSSYTVFLNNEGKGMAAWQDEKAKYTLAMTENAAAKLLNTMRTAILQESGFGE